MSVLISVPIGMAISQYSNLNHACVVVKTTPEANDRFGGFKLHFNTINLSKTDRCKYFLNESYAKLKHFLNAGVTVKRAVSK